nr:uncharacterized protein LOC109147157 isoform X1 [Ipomoea batatas]GME20414.1 uncharacterized protein LOC109147157 isoform X1 [Ipomoea batatas]
MCEYTANKVARNTAVKTAYAECATLLDGTTLQLKVAVNILKHSGVDGYGVTVEDQISCKQVEVYSVAAGSILTQLKYNMKGK